MKLRYQAVSSAYKREMIRNRLTHDLSFLCISQYMTYGMT